MPTVRSLVDTIRERGPVTVAAFMDLALYDPTFGYYARAPRRSGRAGDFFTSVDVGPLFGELLAVQFAEMLEMLHAGGAPSEPAVLDLIEAGAGNGRLALDVLRGLDCVSPRTGARVALHLVETSATARSEHTTVLGPYAQHLASSSADLPAAFTGILFGNELLDAFPVHQVVARRNGLHEMYVTESNGELTISEGALSDPRLIAYFEDLGIALEPGWTAEISLAAVDWMRIAARRLQRGFMLFIDYGHPARELYSVTHAQGTLTSFSDHRMSGPEQRGAPVWLTDPGERDITAHVDFTSIQRAAEGEGMETIALLDQTYFVLGMLGVQGAEGAPGTQGATDRARSFQPVRALKTLLMPGGLGSTMKVLILGKNVGTPRLKGCSYRVRIT